VTRVILYPIYIEERTTRRKVLAFPNFSKLSCFNFHASFNFSNWNF